MCPYSFFCLFVMVPALFHMHHDVTPAPNMTELVGNYVECCFCVIIQYSIVLKQDSEFS